MSPPSWIFESQRKYKGNLGCRKKEAKKELFDFCLNLKTVTFGARTFLPEADMFSALEAAATQALL